MKAIQDRYSPEFAHCFGCGPKNESGWALKSFWDSATRTATAAFTPKPAYTGGWPDGVYGGVLAAVLDCHCAAAASAALAEELGLDEQAATPRCVTASITVDYAKPTPISATLELRASVASVEGRKVWLDASVLADGEPTVNCRALMIHAGPLPE